MVDAMQEEIERLRAQVTRLQAGATAELVKHRTALKLAKDALEAETLRVAARDARVAELTSAVKVSTPSHRRMGECWCDHGEIQHTTRCMAIRAALSTKGAQR